MEVLGYQFLPEWCVCHNGDNETMNAMEADKAPSLRVAGGAWPPIRRRLGAWKHQMDGAEMATDLILFVYQVPQRKPWVG